MLVKLVTTLDGSLDKSEFVELADLYIRITKVACKIENIEFISDFTSTPFNELRNIGCIESDSDILFLRTVLKDLYSEYIAAVNMVVKNDVLRQYVRKGYNLYRMQEQLKHQNDNYTIADFFCGAGGLSLGFRQAGFKIELANDIEDVCIASYRYNHPEIPTSQIIKGDIKELIEHIEDYLHREIDVVVGGPPCQGFSQANKNHRVIDDPRNKLYKYYLKAIEKIVPKFVIMENVRGMLKVANQVLEDYQAIRCQKNGNEYTYEVDYKLLNSELFSVAQSRERLIYIAIRNDVSEQLGIRPADIFKMIENSCARNPIYTLQDALSYIKPLDAERQIHHNEIDSEISGKKVMLNEYEFNKNKYLSLINSGRKIPIIFNHKARYCSDVNYEIYKRLNPGDDATDEKIKDIMPYAHRNHCFKDKYYKLIADKPCRTITAHLRMDCHSHIHPFQVRALTPREAARVQSFPDDYVFLGAYLKTYMQVGNAVPPLMAREIAKVILGCLRKVEENNDY